MQQWNLFVGAAAAAGVIGYLLGRRSTLYSDGLNKKVTTNTRGTDETSDSETEDDNELSLIQDTREPCKLVRPLL
jgi:hypothetical protein